MPSQRVAVLTAGGNKTSGVSPANCRSLPAVERRKASGGVVTEPALQTVGVKPLLKGLHGSGSLFVKPKRRS